MINGRQVNTVSPLDIGMLNISITPMCVFRNIPGLLRNGIAECATDNTGFCATYLHQCPNCTPLLAPHPGRRGQLGTRPPPTVIILNYTLDRPGRPLIVMSS